MKVLRVPFLLFALPAALAGLAPAVFIYDRVAILHGEWWRLWTGHWVHFSFSHLAWDLAVVLAAGAWLERLRPGLLVRLAVIGAPLSSVGLLGLTPDMQRYGGLSGLAMGTVTLLALTQLESRRSGRGWWIGLLVLVAAKIIFDATHSGSLLSRFEASLYQTSVAAHILGAGLALVVFLSHRSAMCHSLPRTRS